MTTSYFVSDLHGDKVKYELLAKEIARNKASFLFIGGDLLPHIRISDKQKQNEVNPFFEEFLFPLFVKLQNQMGCNYPEVYVIPGNDDYMSDLPGFQKGAEKELWKLLNNSKARFGPYHIYGYSYVPPTPFMIKDWEKFDIDHTLPTGSIHPQEGYRSVPDTSENISLIKDDLNELAGNDTLTRGIFIMHSPPFDSVLDKIPGNISIGSKAIADFINERQPYITLHGHAHESSSVTGKWHQVFGKTHSFSAAYDGKGLAIVIFQIDDPANCERKIIE